MQYMGGKSRISKDISRVITEIALKNNNSFDNFVSLFCGSCSIESKMAGFKNKIANDNNKYLISMLKGVQQGCELPDTVTKEEYYRIKNDKNRDMVLTGFVAFGCSFGGKFFGGYAKNKKGDNYAKRAKKSLLKDMSGLKDAVFVCGDYKDVTIPTGSVVYADPPYANTTRYDTGDFDTNEFWDYMRKISKDNLVFISEQNAPEDFVVIWEKPLTRILDVNKENQFVVKERLYVYKNGMVQYD